jgi:hypothetical protein
MALPQKDVDEFRRVRREQLGHDLDLSSLNVHLEDDEIVDAKRGEDPIDDVHARHVELWRTLHASPSRAQARSTRAGIAASSTRAACGWCGVRGPVCVCVARVRVRVPCVYVRGPVCVRGPLCVRDGTCGMWFVPAIIEPPRNICSGEPAMRSVPVLAPAGLGR